MCFADSFSLADDLQDILMADEFGFGPAYIRKVFISADDEEELRDIAAFYDAIPEKVVFFDPDVKVEKPLGIAVHTHQRRINELGAEEYMYSLVDQIAAGICASKTHVKSSDLADMFS